jgi:hypothetical protein
MQGIWLGARNPLHCVRGVSPHDVIAVEESVEEILEHRRMSKDQISDLPGKAVRSQIAFREPMEDIA